MMRHILLAVRPDARAAATIETGAWLARELGAAVTLLYVAVELETVPQLTAGAGLSEDAAEQRIREEVLQALDGVKRQYLDGVPVTLRVERGDVVDRISTIAAEMGASLVVIGTQGRSGAARLVLGDTADAVLRASHCPVVVVPRRHEGEE